MLVQGHRRPERVVDLTEQADRALAGVLHAPDVAAGGRERGTCPHDVRELEVAPLTGTIESEARDQGLGSVEVTQGDRRVDRDDPRLGDAVVGWPEVLGEFHGCKGSRLCCGMVSGRPVLDGKRRLVLRPLLNIR